MKYYKKTTKGFTLIELLVSIGIIAILSGIIYPSFTTARKRGRVAQRISDMKQIQAALALYYAANHSYPSTSGGWRGTCSTYGSYSANNVIPGLAPLYIPSVPTDPQSVAGSNSNCGYTYLSNGSEYALMDYDIQEMYATQSTPNYLTYPELIDPTRDGGVSLTAIDGQSPTSWKVYTPGAVGW